MQKIPKSTKLQHALLSERHQFINQLSLQLQECKPHILQENAKDLSLATNKARLDLSKSFDSMIKGLSILLTLPDPLNVRTLHKELSKDLVLERLSVPLGCILVIFEARPEVLVNVAALCILSGNCCLLKGGSEASRSNAALFDIVDKVASSCGFADALSLVERHDVDTLLKSTEIDLVIPRGSKSLVEHVKRNTMIPVLGHSDGLCTIYLDESADLLKAVSVVQDAKLSYFEACNAVETLLVHESLLSEKGRVFFDSLQGIQLKCHKNCYDFIKTCSVDCSLANSSDFDIEFLAPTMAVKAVGNSQEAISHINTHGSKHTDAILTQSLEKAKEFQRNVDSANVYVNASTRFADGFRYGFGAEVGVSTSKIHTRGPAGLDSLVTYKYLLKGAYDVTQGWKGEWKEL